MAKDLIELFTKGCPDCEGWLAYGEELAGSGAGYELRVWDEHNEHEAGERKRRMAVYGIAELPAMVVKGRLLNCCAEARP